MPAARADRICELEGSLKGGRILTEKTFAAIASMVMDDKKIVILKSVFPAALLADLRGALIAWGDTVDPAVVDDFRGNYHRRRAMVSRLQQAPHVFHDYNFNALGELRSALGEKLRELFEPVRLLYNALTSYDTQFSIPATGPYLHPQIIHYPNGGGFFGRHWHNLLPQKLGLITVLSEYGLDFNRGATVFDIDGEVVDMEGRQHLGDICIWRYDYHHWVSQSNLEEKFDWNSTDGRWVATFAYFDPFG